MNKFLAILIILCFYVLGVSAQTNTSVEEDSIQANSLIIQPNRMEFEMNTIDRDFHIVTAEDKGLMVVQETRARSKEGFIWYVYMLDTALNEIWKKEIIVNYGFTFLGHDFNQQDFILLFGTSEYDLEEMMAMKISLDGKDLLTYAINTVLPLQLSHFEVIADGLIFGGLSKGRPVIVFFDLITKRPKVLPGIYNHKSSIVSIETSDEYKMFSVLISEKTISKDYSITLKVFSSTGDLLYSSTLETEREKSLVDAVSTNFRNGVQYVSGTFASRKTERSVGFYLAEVVKGKQMFIKYHPYADLYNFFSYMEEKREGRVKKRIEKKKIRGKKVKLNYRLLVHEIVRRGDEYVLIGEAYYPKYASSTSYNSIFYDPYAPYQPQQTQQQGLLGYQYTHAVVVGFNENGDIIWDNSFEISDVLLPSLEKNIQVTVEEDKITLLYAFDNTIRSKVISGSNVLEGKSYEPILLTNENDKVREGRFGIEGLKEWYDSNFYAFGTQRIKNNRDQNVKLNRKVFYINKVSLR